MLVLIAFEEVQVKDALESQAKIGTKHNVNYEICSEGYIVQYLKYSVNVVITKHRRILARYQGRYLISKSKDKARAAKHHVGYTDQQQCPRYSQQGSLSPRYSDVSVMSQTRHCYVPPK